MSDTLWTLWIVHGTDGKRSELTQVYARDEQHARERARTWLEAHSSLSEISFKAYPNGFQMVHRWLPGTILVGEVTGDERRD